MSFRGILGRRLFGKIRDKYEDLVRHGCISSDSRQLVVVEAFDTLRLQILNPKKPEVSTSTGFFGLFETKEKKENTTLGLYIHGGCGTGKSFLMDLFYKNVEIENKERLHFHEFMIKINSLLNEKRKRESKFEKAMKWTATAAEQQRKSLQEDPKPKVDLLLEVAEEIVKKTKLLCFDEFQVIHISDAVVIRSLFEHLFRLGLIVCATSNRPPEDLYLNGLNRNLFLPFIPLLKKHARVIPIESQTDYRFLRKIASYQTWTTDPDQFEQIFQKFCNDPEKTSIPLSKTRSLEIPKSSENHRVAYVQFPYLCDEPLGAGDYIRLCERFRRIFLADVPLLTMENRNQIRRFITLIDAFYEAKVNLFILAETPLDKIFFSGSEYSEQDEEFAFARTYSRLQEMQSLDYLRQFAESVSAEVYYASYPFQEFSQEDLDYLWMRVDRDGNDTLDKEEVRALLNDIFSLQHRKAILSDEIFEICWKAMDEDENGVIDKQEFKNYAENFGLIHMM